jgi:membrane-associated phospholipid phosphatase
MNNRSNLSKQDAISASAFLGPQLRPYVNYFDLSVWGVDFPALRNRYTKGSLFVSYLLDYTVMMVMLGLIGFFSLTHHPDPMFTLDDPALAYPMRPEIIPKWLFFVLCLAVPAVIFVCVNIMLRVKNTMIRGFNRRSFSGKLMQCLCSCAIVEEETDYDSSDEEEHHHPIRDRMDPHKLEYIGFHDLHHAMLGLATAVLISLLITSFLWIVAPGLRPNFYAECKIQKDKIIAGKILYTISEICDPSSFKDLIVTPAFPSGHAANAFACWIYTFLYLNGKFKIWDNHSHAWKIFLCFGLPLLVPTGIAASRYTDYHHSGFQIIFGSVLGIIGAFAAYRLYFCAWFDNKYNHLATCFTWISQTEYQKQLMKRKKDSLPYYVEDSGLTVHNESIGVPETNTRKKRNGKPLSISSIENPDNPQHPNNNNETVSLKDNQKNYGSNKKSSIPVE